MKFAFEGILLALLIGLGIFMVGIPLAKVFRLLFPKKVDSLEEAKVRLEVARKEAEAARLNKETEKVYSEIYSEILEDDDTIEKESDRKING